MAKISVILNKYQLDLSPGSRSLTSLGPVFLLRKMELALPGSPPSLRLVQIRGERTTSALETIRHNEPLEGKVVPVWTWPNPDSLCWEYCALVSLPGDYILYGHFLKASGTGMPRAYHTPKHWA